MTQDNLLVLLPPPDVARQVRRLQKAHYERSGDFSPYSTPVAVILGRCASTRFDRRTLHIAATFSSDDVIKTGFGHVLRCSADLSPLQRDLDLPQTECGILFSKATTLSSSTLRLFTLPSDCRPAEDVSRARMALCVCDGGDTAIARGINVTASGSVQFQNASGGTQGINGIFVYGIGCAAAS